MCPLGDLRSTSLRILIRFAAGLLAASGVIAGLQLLAVAPWPGDFAVLHAETLTPYAGVVVTAALCVALDVARPLSDAGGTVRLVAVANVLALLVYGVQAAFVTALASAVAGTLPLLGRMIDRRVIAIDMLAPIAATIASSLAYEHLHAPPIPLTWPWLALPAVAVALTYAATFCAISDMGGHLTGTIEPTYRWPAYGFRGVPGHVVVVAAAFAVLAMIEYRAWSVLAVAAIPLAAMWLSYRAGAVPRERGGRPELTRSTDHGIAIVDRRCVVQQWNTVMAELLGVPDASARGRSLAGVFRQTPAGELTLAVAKTLESGAICTLTRVAVATGAGPRVLSVTVLPDREGALLVCRDCTDQAEWERLQRENAERFSIVAEAANDGIWELNLASGALFVTARCQTMLGLPSADERTSRDVWVSRTHPDDRKELERALDSLTAGTVSRLELQHRLRHENGSYRTVVCRAVAVHEPNGHPVRAGGSLTDTTETAIAQAKIHSAESRDRLTGLLNRAAFVTDIGRRLIEFREGCTARFAALYLDLDRFKVVNDSLGHLVGDELLDGGVAPARVVPAAGRRARPAGRRRVRDSPERVWATRSRPTPSRSASRRR